MLLVPRLVCTPDCVGRHRYRLCSAREALTEDCFQRTPLEFVREQHAIEWNNGTRLLVPNGQFIDEGVIPVGASWARNPIPPIAAWRPGCGANATGGANATDPSGKPCLQFDPPCAGDHGWVQTAGSVDPTDVVGACSGNWIDGLIVDQLLIPAALAPGAYVLGFRWDAEQTTQASGCGANISM